MTAHPAPPAIPASPTAALVTLGLTALLSSLGTSIANVGLPALMHAFSASFKQVQWVVLAYLLAITVLSVTAGRFGDQVGRRRLLLAGQGLFTAASALCALAPTLPVLIAARAAQGTGAAVMLALTLAMIGEFVAPERTGRAVGFLGTATAVGTALGPVLGGSLLGTFGWPALFLATVPGGLVALALTVRRLPTGAPGARMALPLDGWGVLQLTAALTAAALFTTASGLSPLPRLALLAVAAWAGVLVWTRTPANRAPVLPRAVLRTPGLRSGLAVTAVGTAVVMATLVVGPFYLAGAFGLPPAQVGAVMAAGPITAALAGLPAGRGVDRVGPALGLLAGLLVMLLGCGLLIGLPVTAGLGGYVVPLGVLTAGYALAQAANTTAVMRAAAAEERGMVAGLLSLARNTGLLAGTAVLGAVFAQVSSGAGEAGPLAVSLGLRTTVGVAAGLVLVSVGLTWRGR